MALDACGQWDQALEDLQAQKLGKKTQRSILHLMVTDTIL